MANYRYAKGVAAGDFDNDGDLDLYVSNVGRNRLYRNEGNGSFVDMAEELGVIEPIRRSFAAWFFDYDNDGWLDLFVSGYEASIENVARDYLGFPHGATRPRLYRNDGGKFTEVGKEVGLDHAYLPMGANFGDLDHDGYLDIYLGTGDPFFETLTPNVMLRNDSGKRFQDVTTSGGFGHLQKDMESASPTSTTTATKTFTTSWEASIRATSTAMLCFRIQVTTIGFSI